ncbi:zinc finger protein [Indivirus ILV1]|uniref:Zinc finger protein n=1 Tax=Indivirus ILV1 TaxID=1977633 RepID=A0A1V0SDW2_9VIRU|nr:zinc finger protein [Indivirus ILV1]
MSKYHCEICVFSTVNKTDYSRHNKTKKHLEKVKYATITQPELVQISEKIIVTPQYECEFCHVKFTRLSNLSRHKKICINANIININNNHMKEKVESLETQLKEARKQIDTYESLLKSALTPHIINNFTYISNNYPNTPALESQKSYNNLLEAKTMTLIEVITMYHDKKRMPNFIGDYIIKMYKKEDANEQSMWSSDISRLTYIIRESVNKENIWSYDKKGIQTKKIIIDPALEYIKEYLIEFCDKNGTSTNEPKFTQLRAAVEILQYINSGLLADDVIRYIAPVFSIKQNEIKEIEGPKQK